jgi:hypothetical protein
MAAAVALSDLEPGGHLRDLADAETQPLTSFSTSWIAWCTVQHPLGKGNFDSLPVKSVLNGDAYLAGHANPIHGVFDPIANGVGDGGVVVAEEQPPGSRVITVSGELRSSASKCDVQSVTRDDFLQKTALA